MVHKAATDTRVLHAEAALHLRAHFSGLGMLHAFKNPTIKVTNFKTQRNI
jgi:hypothetical protein